MSSGYGLPQELHRSLPLTGLVEVAIVDAALGHAISFRPLHPFHDVAGAPKTGAAADVDERFGEVEALGHAVGDMFAPQAQQLGNSCRIQTS